MSSAKSAGPSRVPRGLRRLQLEQLYHWKLHYRLRKGKAGRSEEVFSAFLEGCPRAPLRILFPETAAHGPAGISRSGEVCDYREPAWCLSLHRPATAAALIVLARDCGWAPAANPRIETLIENGYDWLRAHPDVLAALLASSEGDEA